MSPLTPLRVKPCSPIPSKILKKEFSQLFIRVHRSALVARDAIEGLTYAEGHLAVKLRDITIQPIVSRRLEPKLRQLVPQL